jgi:hypothetical protein
VLIVPSPTECAKFLLDGQIPIVQREGRPLPKMFEYYDNYLKLNELKKRKMGSTT